MPAIARAARGQVDEVRREEGVGRIGGVAVARDRVVLEPVVLRRGIVAGGRSRRAARDQAAGHEGDAARVVARHDVVPAVVVRAAVAAVPRGVVGADADPASVRGGGHHGVEGDRVVVRVEDLDPEVGVADRGVRLDQRLAHAVEPDPGAVVARDGVPELLDQLQHARREDGFAHRAGEEECRGVDRL